MSDNIDRRYFPGIIKTLELYYLQHIAEAAASGVLKFYVKRDLRGGFSNIMLESTEGMGDFDPMGVILEDNEISLKPDTPEMKMIARIKEAIEVAERDVSAIKDSLSGLHAQVSGIEAQYGGPPKRKNPHRGIHGETIYKDNADYQTYLDIQSEIVAKENEIKKLEGRIDGLKRQLAQAESKAVEAERIQKDKEAEAQRAGTSTDRYEATTSASVKVDTQTMMDLRPTSISIDVNVRVKKSMGVFKSTEYMPSRSIPISVKIVPMVVKNFDDIYSVLIDDMYANKYSSLYRSAVRSFSGRMQNWFGGTVRKFVNAFIPSEEINVWRDILLSRKGFTDASTFRSADRGPKYQKYAAAIVIMSSDDIRHQEQNFFNNPSKIKKLFQMGWNSFAILNDADQKLTFCSYYENGMCAKIPYNYLFHSLKATDVFKEMEQLGGFTRRVIGNFKRMNMKKLSESIDVQNEVEKKVTYMYNNYRKAVDDGLE
jgi:hypothetical protein